MEYQPLVSIIMPSYNSARTIAESIESVMAQTYQNWELLITDDVSVDNTRDIVRSYCEKDNRIKLFELDKNSGAGASRNNSIESSKGDYIAFLDSDDLWFPDKLLIQIAFMKVNNVLLSYSAYQKFGANGDGGIITPPNSVTYNQLLTGNVIGCLTAIYNAKILGKRYMPLIRKRQDMGLWLSILKDIDKAFGIDSVLAKYRVDTGMTQNKLTILKWQWAFYREVVGLNFFEAIKCFILYAYKGFLKSRI
ncbi:glycosyl transferase [Shewanella hafniensis]|uniref:glycosyltransferase family 2 protein n=1 Tax=Shewanella hafniensis TaxID=365590 RepID=UPI001BBE332B|nr:glycosyltransferase family 2 protein [Shewanella hafniensis]MCL1133010.1 glycosyltransferase [Shewanella hafniensis]GIU37019.1 glycosyl transferase [Shewanella hafniensis]